MKGTKTREKFGLLSNYAGNNDRAERENVSCHSKANHTEATIQLSPVIECTACPLLLCLQPCLNSQEALKHDALKSQIVHFFHNNPCDLNP